MSNPTERDDDHLAAVADGCGCAELWEHMSEQRDGDDADTAEQTAD